MEILVLQKNWSGGPKFQEKWFAWTGPVWTNRWCALIGALPLAPGAVPGENFSSSERMAPDGNKDVWTCRSSRQGKDFLTCIKCTTDCLHDLDQISRGGPFIPKKWVLGEHFSTENFGLGDQNFQDQNSDDRLHSYLC